ncbi:MAG: GNAT family N-acetyltransferase [Pseudomonadota bacterium]
MPSFAIRPVAPDDGDTLWALLEPVFRAGDTYAVDADITCDAALTYWTDPPHSAFLAEDIGAANESAETIDPVTKALGTYYLMPNQKGGGRHVANAGVVPGPAARGRGVARAMLHHAEAEARRAGFRAMQFNFVVSTNAAALHIWASEGYREVGRLPGAFLHPTHGYVDALVLFKSLIEAS